MTTASSDGAVNAMHDSFTPLGGGMLIANMMMDEVIIGAPGSGLFGMLLFALVAVFVAGLMVGSPRPNISSKIQSRPMVTPPGPSLAHPRRPGDIILHPDVGRGRRIPDGP